MSALLSAGASLVPSPVTATILALTSFGSDPLNPYTKTYLSLGDNKKMSLP
jgi:hypothetical protein